nr:hypothetical protein Iba_chr08bCG7100 [Ipomoea batatas]
MKVAFLAANTIPKVKQSDFCTVISAHNENMWFVSLFDSVKRKRVGKITRENRQQPHHYWSEDSELSVVEGEAAVAGTQLDNNVVFVVVDEGRSSPRIQKLRSFLAANTIPKVKQSEFCTVVSAHDENMWFVSLFDSVKRKRVGKISRENRRRPRHCWFDRRSAVSAQDR